MTDEQFSKFLEYMGNICGLRDDFHKMATDVELIKQNQEHNIEINTQRHKDVIERIGKLEKSDEKQRSIIDRASGGVSTANWFLIAGVAIASAAISGVVVYFL